MLEPPAFGIIAAGGDTSSGYTSTVEILEQMSGMKKIILAQTIRCNTGQIN